MFRLSIIISLCFLLTNLGTGQSISFKSYMNPVIPGDHPDPTLTIIGNDFYTSGSSFNPTPKIYHSTDLVHWEVIAQPVKASWSNYGNTPGGGIWGGHMVFYDNLYWHYFGKGGSYMYFVTADLPEGPWSDPIQVQIPVGMTSLGVDNSIFIDKDSGKWYMLTKAGRENNHIVELGNDGQPTGVVLDLTWLNPDSEGNPYGWAEGPVMWKHNGYYYYSFAQHLSGAQYVMRSDTLTADKTDWTIIGTNIFTGSTYSFSTPNHISPAVLLDDSTSWVIAHSYYTNWLPQGRQGLLCQVTYNDAGFPKIQRPSDDAVIAPNLPSSGIPWMVPHSDFFKSENLNPEWSFLGYTFESSYSLSERPGWLRLSTAARLGTNTIIKNDGEHNYSLITRVDFESESTVDEAGLWIINGPETHQVKLYSTMNADNQKVIVFSFQDTKFEIENTVGSVVWLKLVREEHMMSGYYSSDGFNWNQIGEAINASEIDIEQTQFNDFTGNQQGLYIRNKSAYFDLYIYRDAYTPILAAYPANQFGTSLSVNRYPPNSLGDIHNNDWALYAGVEFGNDEYPITPDSLNLNASCSSTGGVVEVWLDSIDTGKKIAECTITSTGSWDNFQIFKTEVDSVSGKHDLYLRFLSSETEKLFVLNWFKFVGHSYIPSSVENESKNSTVNSFSLEQNYPNPFNPITHIIYSVPKSSSITIKVYNILGQEVKKLFDGIRQQGNYSATLNAEDLSSGIYLYQLKAENFVETKKLVLLK